MVSVLEVEGRSERLTGGRKVESIAPEVEVLAAVRKVVWEVGGGPVVGTAKVNVKPEGIKRLANSVSGMRWPIPGLGQMTTCAGGDDCVLASMINRSLDCFRKFFLFFGYVMVR